MSTLYDLTGKYFQLSELFDESEEGQEFFLAAMKEISDEIEVKAENYAKVIRNMEATIDSIALEQKRLAARKSTLENRITQLKNNLQEVMIATGKTKFKTDLFSFSIQKNGGALPVIVDVDVSKLPDDLVIITEKPDLKAIGKYIEETGDVTYAHFGERGESLRIK